MILRGGCLLHLQDSVLRLTSRIGNCSWFVLEWPCAIIWIGGKFALAFWALHAHYESGFLASPQAICFGMSNVNSLRPAGAAPDYSISASRAAFRARVRELLLARDSELRLVSPALRAAVHKAREDQR